MSDRLFCALLKYWRRRHGQSQLDLALAADVSARHLSWLESGRARPSESMVLRLMSALSVPLRDQNDMLRAAGFASRFAEPSLQALSQATEWAIERMLRQQEPYPLTLLSPDYRIVRSNGAAERLFSRFMAEPQRWTESPDMFSLVFDPALARPFIVDWPRLARQMLARLQRESLQCAGDERLTALLERVLRYPGVDAAWRQPDFSLGIDSSVGLRLQRGDLALGFMTTLTRFAETRLVTLDELRIESFFPLDEASARACERIAADASRV